MLTPDHCMSLYGVVLYTECYRAGTDPSVHEKLTVFFCCFFPVEQQVKQQQLLTPSHTALVLPLNERMFAVNFLFFY